MTLKTRGITLLFLGFIALIVLNCSEARNPDCKNTFLEIILELCHGSRLKREGHISASEKRYRRRRQSPEMSFPETVTAFQVSKLPKESGIDSILNLSWTEMDEIIEEYYTRETRSSFTKEELMDKVAKCCSNVEYCRKNPHLVCGKIK